MHADKERSPDMTERHSLEKRYRIALEAAQIGIWTWCRSSEHMAWDDVAASIVGISGEARLGLLDWETLVVDEDRTRVRAAFAAALDASGPGSLSFEARIHHPDDDAERWLSVHGHAEFEAGAAERLCGAVRDITEARRLDVDSGRAAARLDAIVSIAADAIISIDGAQRITLFNNGAEHLFGYAKDEVIGQPLALLLPERFRANHGDQVRRFGTSQSRSRSMGERSEIFARRKDGHEFAAEASISHVEVNGERIFAVVLRDISERKRAIDVLASSRDELEARVAERTAELKAEMQRREETQAQLVRTQRMEAFGQLTGGIAHDFNNLLTVITGNLELIEMRLEDEKSRLLLSRARDAAEMGARLTSRLLTFARRRRFETAPLNLNEQVMGMVDLLRRTLGEDVDLNARLAPRLWTVAADPSEVENAVLNLAINARDAMPRGGRLVIETANVTADAGQIGAIEKLPAGAYVRLSVSDSGTGMSPDVLRHAFEPFFTTKPTGKGTGLGLSTIYGFAEQSGGTATIYSEPGVGTTVSLYLPRVAPTDDVAAMARDTAQPPIGQGETILLVEDNAAVRAVTSERLAALNYRVVEAESGPAAIALLEQGAKADLVFSDVIMAGGLSGYDVARAVRGLRPDTPVLLTSGYPDDILRAEALEVQGLRMLRKPYNRDELARHIRETLDAKRQAT